MVKRLGALDDEQGVIAVECNEPEYQGYRTIRFSKLSKEKLRYYYEKMKEFDVLFNDWIRGDETEFIHSFLRNDGQGGIEATGIIWEVDDVGIIFLTQIVPGAKANAHFTFWDKRLKGREDLVREFLEIGMKELQFKRVEVEIPFYAYPLFKFVEKVGFKNEGRKRNAILYKNQWFDTNLYSVIPEDFEDGEQDSKGTTKQSGDSTSSGRTSAVEGSTIS